MCSLPEPLPSLLVGCRRVANAGPRKIDEGFGENTFSPTFLGDSSVMHHRPRGARPANTSRSHPAASSIAVVHGPPSRPRNRSRGSARASGCRRPSPRPRPASPHRLRPRRAAGRIRRRRPAPAAGRPGPGASGAACGGRRAPGRPGSGPRTTPWWPASARSPRHSRHRRASRACANRSPGRAAAGRPGAARPRRAAAAPSPPPGCRRRCRRRRPAGPDPRELGGVLGAPAGGGQAILRRRGERVFRRQAVVDRGDHASRPGAEVAADAVMRVEAAEHEAAAVVEDQQREGPLPRGV